MVEGVDSHYVSCMVEGVDSHYVSFMVEAVDLCPTVLRQYCWDFLRQIYLMNFVGTLNGFSRRLSFNVSKCTPLTSL